MRLNWRFFITLAVVCFALWCSRANSDESARFVIENKTQTAFVVENKIPSSDSRPATLDDLRKLLGTDDIPADAAPTPHTEISRVLALMPRPEIAFVEYGCGGSAPWCIAAVEKWRCKAIGIEIDPARASAARERVREAGLGNLITIITGDATTTDVNADVGVAYLYADVLQKLKPRIEKLSAFASYMHKPPVPATRNGDSWIWTRPVQQTAAVAVWGGYQYAAPQCDDPNCGMCASIRAQLAAKPTTTKQVAQPATLRGHWEVEDRAVCTFNSRGRKTGCTIQKVNVWVEDK